MTTSISPHTKDLPAQRENRPLSYRPMAMPWSHQGEDERRFRKILITLMTLSLGLAAIAPFIKLPPLDKTRTEPIPDRIVEMIKKKQATPPEPKPVEKKDGKKEEKPSEEKEQKPAEKKSEKKEEAAPPQEAPAAAVPDSQIARARAETKGVLAFKNNFADLLQDSAPARQDADVRISNSGRQAAAGEPAQRALITAQAGSGGISTAGLSRQVAGNTAQAITASGSKFARVESTIGSGVDRPLSKGTGPARTDEEIQIVFDKYKTALDRIYQRELRNDPSLSGRIELMITIEPDGHVSACSVKSSDLASATLKDDVVERVKKFNFGAKDGVPSIKIVFPVDFHPVN